MLDRVGTSNIILYDAHIFYISRLTSVGSPVICVLMGSLTSSQIILWDVMFAFVWTSRSTVATVMILEHR